MSDGSSAGTLEEIFGEIPNENYLKNSEGFPLRDPSGIPSVVLGRFLFSKLASGVPPDIYSLTLFLKDILGFSKTFFKCPGILLRILTGIS